VNPGMLVIGLIAMIYNLISVKKQEHEVHEKVKIYIITNVNAQTNTMLCQTYWHV